MSESVSVSIAKAAFDLITQQSDDPADQLAALTKLTAKLILHNAGRTPSKMTALEIYDFLGKRVLVNIGQQERNGF